jgi:hypothetical protein
MFSLVISIIAIALGAVLLFSTAYYGGDSLNEGTVKAKVSQFKNEAHQISSALTLYKVENGGFNTDDGSEFSWQTLVDKEYLKQLPQSGLSEDGSTTLFSWGIRDNVIFLPNVSDEVCVTANRVDGYETQFGSDPSGESVVIDSETFIGNWEEVSEGTYIPVCADTLSDRVPCCFDDTPSV